MDLLHEEEEEWDEDEDHVILMTMEMMDKKPKHGGSIDGCVVIHGRRQEAHRGVMLEYFRLLGVPRAYHERYFHHRFWMAREQ
jgi:hypothetical protein